MRKGAAPPTPAEGDVEGIIKIPRIGIDMAFVEGTNRDDLKKGPGHYPDTPPPGTLGNAAIAGHRTTYLHPFYDVDKLVPGDKIIIETLDHKTFTYAMYQQLIVKPTDVYVVDNTADAELTLTSCNPKYSAAQRIVIKARLVANQSAKPTKAPPPPARRGQEPHRAARRGLVERDQERAARDLLGWRRAAVRARVVVGVSPLASPGNLGRGRDPVLDPALPLLRLPRTGDSAGLVFGVRGVTRADIDAAATRIAPFVERTPVLRFAALDAWVGAEAFVKAEHQQRTGAFKYRGATNAVQSLSSEVAERGVAAHSSGNHAAALAAAARVRGIPAYVVMPEATTAFKQAAVARFGAEITLCANSLEARRTVLREVVARTGATEIHPFEDLRVIAGAGTAALELLDEVGNLDVVITPVGGGGLCSGSSIAVAPIRVIGAHPVDRGATIADGLRTGTSPVTNAMLDARNVERVAVAEAAIAEAVDMVRALTGESIEPSAAIAFAAARAGRLHGRRVGIICSGGNVA